MEEEKNNSPRSSGLIAPQEYQTLSNLNNQINNNQINSSSCRKNSLNKNAIYNCSQIDNSKIQDEIAEEKPKTNLFTSEQATINSSYTFSQQKIDYTQKCHNSQIGQQYSFQIQSRQQCLTNERNQNLSQQSQIISMNNEQDKQNQNQYLTTAESNSQSYYTNTEGRFDSHFQTDQQNINSTTLISNIQIVKNQIPCQMIEDLDSAQQPYPTLQKKQIQPCCAQQSNDLCKYTSFLSSNDERAQLEALKYFECNLKDYSTTDLLRLFNHKFIDCLVEKSKNVKDIKTAQMAMKVIFCIARLKRQDLQYNNKNIFFEKLLALEFPQIINKFKQEKVNNQRQCCFSNQVEELILSLKKYKYEQENLQSQNRNSSCLQKPRACFLSSLFK